ncbi:hypothetical protein QOZ80_5BG0456590 [Eleusine coracana subsp. coracana]|nr:hypothetical protein QOZ80_5BG0456590 [Eleusine coracana subsp. coracana]
MLLENQIPWSVLQILMEIGSPEPKVPADRFLHLMASVFDIGNVEAINAVASDNTQEEEEKEKQENNDQQPDLEDGGPGTYSRPHRSQVVLPVQHSGGARRDGRQAHRPQDQGIRGHEPPETEILSDMTACWLININMAACLGAMEADNFAVSSYVSVVALLMNREEDVQELHTKGIVHSAFSNEETLTLFKWAARHMRVGHSYYQGFERLNEYRNQRYVWIAIHRFFYNNFKTIAAILSVAGVLAGLFRAILSVKQPQHLRQA